MDTTTTNGSDDVDPHVPVWMEVWGWYGLVAILTAYSATSHGLMEQGVAYQLLNVTGATGLALVCWKRRTWQAAVLEGIWALIGLTALFELLSGTP